MITTHCTADRCVRLQRLTCKLALEAVRAHAASNEGKLPGKLAEIKLPLPLDPVTGKPFLYELKDGTAVIRGTPPPARKADPAYNRVYEITIRK